MVRPISMVEPATIAAASTSELGISLMTFGGGTREEGTHEGNLMVCFF